MEFAVLFSIIADESETASFTRNVRLMISFAPAMVESAPVEEIDTIGNSGSVPSKRT